MTMGSDNLIFSNILLQSNIDFKRLSSGPVLNSKLYYRDKTLIYEYKIPISTFPLSGFLAIIDEFTSWAIFFEDKKNRLASVSTSLEAKIGTEILNDIKAGDIVEFRGR